MTDRLGVIVIHGMGSQKPDFAEEMIDEVNGRLARKHRKDVSRIAWQPVYWADVLEDAQVRYLRAARRAADLDYIGLRRFMLTAFGDAAAYRRADGPNSTYKRIHRVVKEKIRRLYREGLERNEAPLAVMAHSLGGQIMSNYIWDMQKRPPRNLNRFERLETLSGIITFGCNIPMFTLAYDPVEPIAFPPATLPDDLKRKAKWLNFYDPDDVLGYPLKPINAAYSKVVNADTPINVGGLAASWNPASHGGYWTDNDFTKPVAAFLAKFL